MGSARASRVLPGALAGQPPASGAHSTVRTPERGKIGGGADCSTRGAGATRSPRHRFGEAVQGRFLGCRDKGSVRQISVESRSSARTLRPSYPVKPFSTRLAAVFYSPFFRGSFTYLGGSILNSALPLLVVPILTRYLTPADYGSWPPRPC